MKTEKWISLVIVEISMPDTSLKSYRDHPCVASGLKNVYESMEIETQSKYFHAS